MPRAPESRALHVLTLTPLYPSRRDEVEGCYISEPLEHLPKFNVRSTVIAAKPFTGVSFKPSGRAPEAHFVRFPYLPFELYWVAWGLAIYARVARLVGRLHERHKFDLIHAHGGVTCGHPAALLARRLRIPFVVTNHGLDLFGRGLKRPFDRWWCERAARFVHPKAARNICVSEAVSRALVDGLGGDARTSVIYNGVNTELFTPPPGGEAAPTQTVLSVGRLVPEKGQDLVLRAFAELAPQHPNLRYEIIGDGPDRPRQVKLSEELGVAGRVKFLGLKSRREVAEAMRRCTVFALPSRDEALGCVYLEAMATATPVIACRRQGIEEIIRQGVNGWLIQPDSLPELVEALSTLLGNAPLRERVGRAARQTVVEGLTLAHQAERLSQVYRECLGRAAV